MREQEPKVLALALSLVTQLENDHALERELDFSPDSPIASISRWVLAPVFGPATIANSVRLTKSTAQHALVRA